MPGDHPYIHHQKRIPFYFCSHQKWGFPWYLQIHRTCTHCLKVIWSVPLWSLTVLRMEGSGTDSRRIRQNEDMRLPFVPVQRLLTLLKAVLHIFHFFFYWSQTVFSVQEWHFSRSLFPRLHEQYLCLGILPFLQSLRKSRLFSLFYSLFCILSL